MRIFRGLMRILIIFFLFICGSLQAQQYAGKYVLHYSEPLSGGWALQTKKTLTLNADSSYVLHYDQGASDFEMLPEKGRWSVHNGRVQLNGGTTDTLVHLAVPREFYMFQKYLVEANQLHQPHDDHVKWIRQ